MSSSIKDLDPALQGAGHKAYPDSIKSNLPVYYHEILITVFDHFCQLKGGYGPLSRVYYVDY